MRSEIRSSLELLLVENEEIRSDLASLFAGNKSSARLRAIKFEVGTIFPKTDLASKSNLELRLQDMERRGSGYALGRRVSAQRRQNLLNA
jgi:hypothetical protein